MEIPKVHRRAPSPTCTHRGSPTPGDHGAPTRSPRAAGCQGKRGRPQVVFASASAHPGTLDTILEGFALPNVFFVYFLCIFVFQAELRKFPKLPQGVAPLGPRPRPPRRGTRSAGRLPAVLAARRKARHGAPRAGGIRKMLHGQQTKLQTKSSGYRRDTPATDKILRLPTKSSGVAGAPFRARGGVPRAHSSPAERRPLRPGKQWN